MTIEQITAFEQAENMEDYEANRPFTTPEEDWEALYELKANITNK